MPVSLPCRGLTVEVFEVGEEVHFLVQKFRYINFDSIDAGEILPCIITCIHSCEGILYFVRDQVETGKYDRHKSSKFDLALFFLLS